MRRGSRTRTERGRPARSNNGLKLRAVRFFAFMALPTEVGKGEPVTLPQSGELHLLPWLARLSRALAITGAAYVEAKRRRG